MLPKGGVGTYSTEGSVLHNPAADQVFFEYLKTHLPKNIEVIERDTHAEDPAFVKEAIDLLVSLIEEKNAN